MNASVYRDTAFEVRGLVQGPNSFGLQVFDRKAGGLVTLELHESRFTDDEMRQIHEALALLETKAADVYAEHAAKPEDLKAVINAASDAKKELAAAQAAQLAGVAAKADLDAELESKRKEAAQLDADLAAMRAAADSVKKE